MKKRKNRSALRERRQSLLKSKQAQEKTANCEHGPADPMPDGSTRKAGEDVISYLMANGRLTSIQEVAAREIEHVFMERTKGLWARTQEFERLDKSYVAADLSSAIDRERRYDDFARWSAENKIRTKRNYHQLILDACIYGDKMRDFERRHCMKNGTGAVWIIRGLNQYAVCANWMTTAA